MKFGESHEIMGGNELNDNESLSDPDKKVYERPELLLSKEITPEQAAAFQEQLDSSEFEWLGIDWTKVDLSTQEGIAALETKLDTLLRAQAESHPDSPAASLIKSHGSKPIALAVAITLLMGMSGLIKAGAYDPDPWPRKKHQQIEHSLPEITHGP